MADTDCSRADFRFFHPFRVRYSEIDGQAVVYNAHYLTYFDTAIFEFYRVIGYDQFTESKTLLEDWHVVRALVEYRAPLTYDLEFEVGVRVGRMGNSSLAYALAIFPKGGDAILATGEVVQVYTDQRTHKSMPIPARVRALFDSFAAPGIVAE
jgi:acyl-CoA thioester hydrolase